MAAVAPRGPNDAQLPQRPRSDIEIYQGDDCAWTVLVFETDGETPADLTGYTPKAQIRRDCADRSAIIAEMSAVVADALAGEITLSVTHTQTEGIRGGGYVWDMQLISSDGIVQTIIGGRATVMSQVTI